MSNNFTSLAAVLTLLFAGLYNFSNAQNISINATGAAPDGGAMLDIASANKGLLVPRVNIANVNTIAPIVGSSTVSMLVYNTNASTGVGYHYWSGARWLRLSVEGSAWSITGNAGTNTTTNFLGTTNNVGLRIRTNNVNRFEFTTGGALRAFANGTAGAPSYSWTTNANMGMYRATNNAMGFSTGGAERMRIGDFSGSTGIGRVPCCGALGGPIVDIFQPLEVGNDVGTNLQATIGYYLGADVVIEPETDWYGYVGGNNAWWRVHAYGFVNVSERSKKKDIIPVNQNGEVENLVIQDIENIKPSLYYYNGQNQSPESEYDGRYRPHYQMGVIVDESPDYILGDKLNGVDVYALASLSLAGVKYNHKRIKELEEVLSLNNTVSDFGSISESGGVIQVAVTYSAAFLEALNGNIPAISLTAISQEPQSLRVVDKTATGFVVVNDGDSGIISFDWTAIAKVTAVGETKQLHSVSDSDILNKMHLSPEEKQQVIDHYSGIKMSRTSQTDDGE